MPRLFLRVLSDAKPLGEEEGYDIEVAWLVAENDGTIRGHGVTDQRGLLDVADPNVEWLQDPANTVVFIPAHFVLKVACQVPWNELSRENPLEQCKVLCFVFVGCNLQDSGTVDT